MVVLDTQLTVDPVARLRAAAGGGALEVNSALRIVVERLVDGLELPEIDHLGDVADRMNVRVQLQREMPVSAMLTQDEQGLKVVYAAGQNEGRRRFTIAHELGHAFLEIHGLGQAPRNGRAVETLCDRFAAELLMPSSMFERELQEGVSLDRLLDLQRRYRTSLRATAIRCSYMTPMALYVADSRDLLWTTSAARTYNSFLRLVVAELFDSGQRLSRDVRFVREGAAPDTWRLEAALLAGSRDAVMLLTPAGQ